MKALAKFVKDVGAPVLVLHDDASADAVSGCGPGCEVHPLGESLPAGQRWAGVAVVTADRGSLRRAVPKLPQLGRTTAILCVMTADDDPVLLASRPDWPPVSRLQARRLRSGGALTVLHLKGPMAVHGLLWELARRAGTSGLAPARIAVQTPGRAGPVGRHPPEIVVVADSRVPLPHYDTEVAPAPVVVEDPELALGPLDEGVLNPIGFHSDHGQELAVLERAQAVDARTVAALRDQQGVRVSWARPTPELARTVAALAMAGIPVVGDRPPPSVRSWLGGSLFDALAVTCDLTNSLRREEQSVRLRRAALLTHSGPGWRARVAGAAGRPAARFPSCSVVLATRRPDQLDFALKQVARQRGIDLELVVVGHGFEPDANHVRERLPHRPTTVRSLPADTLFGEVLNAGVEASSGSVVVKMDDDDWYGPDFLLDLSLAREYSGADVVGTPAEFVYLEELDRTLRRHGTARDASERFATLVAGGTISVPRDLLASLGGFQPVRRFVDQQVLQAAQAAGAMVYRAHGLGFMLRRSSGGHTWLASDEHFLEPRRLGQEWPGFVPTQILEPDQERATSSSRV